MWCWVESVLDPTAGPLACARAAVVVEWVVVGLAVSVVASVP